jgi:hypothetical protein
VTFVDGFFLGWASAIVGATIGIVLERFLSRLGG